MQIKRFVAANMSDALQQIKSELGSDAVILSARSIKSGRAVWGPLRKTAVEVTAATDHRLPQPRNKVKTAFTASRSDHSAAAAAERPHRRHAAIASYARAGASSRSHPRAPAPTTGVHPPIVRRLMRQQVKKIYAEPMSNRFEGNGRANGDVDGLSHALQSMGLSSQPIDPVPGRQKIAALIGPPGVGKTTTVAKLAAHHALQSSLSVACISIDHIRIAGSEQLEVIADIIGVPFATAGRRREIKPTIKKFAHCDLVLIDTPAFHRTQADSLAYISGLLEKIPAVEKHLLVDASSSEEVQIDLVERAAPLNIERLIFTKVDETPTVGSLINLPLDTGLSVSCLTTGSSIPEDLVISTPQYLAGRLLEGKADQTVTPNRPKGKPEKADRIFRVASEKPAQTFYVANQNSDVFHKPDCKWTKMIKEDHIVVFADTIEAKQKRYKPCRYCCPQENRHAAEHGSGSFSSAVGYQ